MICGGRLEDEDVLDSNHGSKMAQMNGLKKKKPAANAANTGQRAREKPVPKNDKVNSQMYSESAAETVAPGHFNPTMEGMKRIHGAAELTPPQANE